MMSPTAAKVKVSFGAAAAGIAVATASVANAISVGKKIPDRFFGLRVFIIIIYYAAGRKSNYLDVFLRLAPENEPPEI